MRIIELPFSLCPSGAFALAALVSRANEQQIGYSAWLGDNYDFAGGIPPESYSLLATSGRFAQFGIVSVDYPITETLDFDVTLNVALQGPDITLDELTGNAGLANELLVFAGAEIMSIVGLTLTGIGSYALQIARGRFGTAQEAHVAGTEVFIIASAALVPLAHAQFAPGVEVAFKFPISAAAARLSEDVSEVDALTHTITGESFAPAPTNLRINGEQRNATFAALADVRIAWSLPDQRSAIAAGLRLRCRTLVEIVGAGDVVLFSKKTYAQQIKILAAKMTTILLGATEFDVRISTDVLGPEFNILSTSQTLHAIQT